MCPNRPVDSRCWAGFIPWVSILFLFTLFFTPVAASAQTFTPIATGLPDLFDGSVRWGDYDSDGDLDLLITGRGSGVGTVTAIYRNDAGTFVDINAGLTAIYEGAAEWGDYDNDNDLDLIISGTVDLSNKFALVYRNDGGDQFTDIEAGLLFAIQGSIDWGDYDNDGDLDLIVMGGAGFPLGEQTRVYENQGNDTFAYDSLTFKGLRFGSVDWGDYDNDGDLDVLATGYPGEFQVLTLLYRNDGGEAFTRIEPGFFNLFAGEGRWGDYDQDGDLDVLINGSDSTAGPIYTFVYRNDGNDVFTDIHATIGGAGEGSSLALGDCDNDGDLDLLMSSAFTHGTTIYRYDSDSTFTELDAGLTSGCCGSLAWGDYDNDNDLDLIALLMHAGTDLYRNDISSPNTPPGQPTGLTEIIGVSDVTLSWLPATDNETASAGLTYNIRMGTTPGGSEIVSAMADPNTGYRKIVAQGNVFHNTSWPITNLAAGTYYWTVQAIDNNFTGSLFAPERSFSIPAPPCDCPAQSDTEPDGFITPLDLAACIDILFSGAEDIQDEACPSPRFDLDCDAFTTTLDLARIIDHLFAEGAGPCDPCAP
jgi:hypothetical protein